ncbi:uncharacterized protein LOC132599620 [Lycium barbarum]|uniref:uncharacterized protein LOC132599620 n=1 Tax=Lycium barbarum TaxID=112863 RepID=UPI00293F0A02|nr:uncharacterized protein LOC132599620 [Lycium barbarum]
MENRSKKLLKNRQQIHIGKSKAEYSILICKKHPKHRQSSSGVCSVCLTEKFTQLSRTSPSSNTTTVTCCCFLSSSLSSLSSSSYTSSSPIHHTMNIMASVLKCGNKSSSVLTKSRSLDFIMEENVKNIGGFLYRLLHPRRNKEDNIKHLVHSRTTMRERLTTKFGITNSNFYFSILDLELM